MIENNEWNNLNDYLNKWIIKKIETELNSLIELKNIKENNPELRALAYRLYENNGVIKRSNISEYLKKISQEDRKKTCIYTKHSILFKDFSQMLNIIN